MKKLGYKKCRHDKCKRKALEDGYCIGCLKLNAKECDGCSNSKLKKMLLLSPAKVIKISEETSPKHNRWIDGFEKGETFFKWISKLGVILLGVLLVYTSIAFWADFMSRHPSTVLVSIGMLVLNIITLSVVLAIAGNFLRWICHFISRLLYSKELERIEKEGEKKYGVEGKSE